MKYRHIILALDDNVLYSPSSIAEFAAEKDMLETSNEVDEQHAKLRIRICFGRRSRAYLYPRKGDGLLEPPGQSVTPAWYGWRWKGTLR